MGEDGIKVNTVFATVLPAGSEDIEVPTGERSPMGLITLLRALQRDASSTLYESPFFKKIDRSEMEQELFVRMCDDKKYRIFCPYVGAIIDETWSLVMFIICLTFFPLGISCCCGLCWIFEMPSAKKDVDDQTMINLLNQPDMVDERDQIEYAQSWIQGRFMNEFWQERRDKKFLALKAPKKA